MSRAIIAVACALVLTVTGCSDSTPPVAASLVSSTIDRIELHAWRETLGPQYPLTIARADSIATVVNFFAPSASSWRDAAAFPGTPILAAFFEGGQLRDEYGFVQTSHGQGGFLVNRTGTRIRVRTASYEDITQFMAFFGVGVVVVKN